MGRHRPRLNITLDQDVKRDLTRKADAMSVSRSRLIEALIREYLQMSRDDPRLDMRVRRAIREGSTSSGSEAEEAEQIEAILEQMDRDP